MSRRGTGRDRRHRPQRGPSGPVNTIAPSIAGDFFVGGELTMTPGTWTQSPVLTYQWQRDSVDIAGETGTTYTLVNADEGTDTTCLEIPDGVTARAVSSNAIAQPTIPPDLVLAWEAWNATPDANGQLETCPDRTGNGNTGTVAAALASRPALSVNALFNGQVTAAMAGTAGHYLRRVTLVQGDIAQPYDVYWVGAQPNVGGTRQQWDSGGDTSKRSIGWKLAGGFAIASVTNLTGGSTAATPVIYGGRFDSNVMVASALYENDPATPVAVGDTGNRALSGLTVAGNNTTTPFSQTFAGIFVASGGMSESARRALFAYVYWRWKVGVAP